MEAAAQPEDSLEVAREKVRETLRKLREKHRNGTLNENSNLFRIKAKLTEAATAKHRRAFLEDLEDEDEEQEQERVGSGVRKIPDPITD
jgi:hypothetical protein